MPQYNPTTVVVSGYAGWGYYPSPYPVYYYPYPPGAAFATGLIWGAAIGAIWSGGRYGANYGGGDININRNTNINTGNINTGNAAAATATQNAGGEKWSSGKQKGQVSRSVGANPPSSRVGRLAWRRRRRAPRPARSVAAARVAVPGRAPARWTAAAAVAAAARRRRRRAAAAAPSAGSMDRGGGGGGGAFDGYGSGRSTQMDSSRGASSRGASPSASSRGRRFDGRRRRGAVVAAAAVAEPAP